VQAGALSARLENLLARRAFSNARKLKQVQPVCAAAGKSRSEHHGKPAKTRRSR
jgi:hypothetical protein